MVDKFQDEVTDDAGDDYRGHKAEYPDDEVADAKRREDVADGRHVNQPNHVPTP